ncbi:uncharacterized protein IL334_007261 [Kwoniella shivajii]|uniref:Uncharacterized protein n=1 Tax=Kwoniella shivajii TaxID=564305 RepID=A0ABZ1DBC0_9TREE|nr:hypothetical protein IL334_007261 [Kwoniella shivajii]
MNIRIDDASPQIKYFQSDTLNEGWVVEHTPTSKYSDRLTGKYSESTFHGTFSELSIGDYMEYRFNGTGITLYGGKRPNHGVYGVKIDNTTEERYDGKGSDTFQEILYSKMGLDEHVEHVVRMANYPSATPQRKGGLWVDLDYIEITHTIPSTMYTSYIDDASPLVTYEEGWISYGYGTGGYYNLTDHMSSTIGSSMQVGFNGTSIQLFGGINNDHAEYSISVDGGVEQVYNANNWEMVFQIPLYTASGLVKGEHTIQMTNRGLSGQNVIGIDYAIFNSSVNPPEAGSDGIQATTASSAGLPFSTTSSSSVGDGDGNDRTHVQSGSSKLNVAALSGGVAGGIVLLALLIVLLIWFYKRRKQVQQEETIDQYHSEGYRPGNASTGRLDLVSIKSPPAFDLTSISRRRNYTPTHSMMSDNTCTQYQRSHGNSNSNPYSSSPNLSTPGIDYFSLPPATTTPICNSSAISHLSTHYQPVYSATQMKSPSEDIWPISNLSPNSTHSSLSPSGILFPSSKSDRHPFGSPMSDRGTGLTPVCENNAAGMSLGFPSVGKSSANIIKASNGTSPHTQLSPRTDRDILPDTASSDKTVYTSKTGISSAKDGTSDQDQRRGGRGFAWG